MEVVENANTELLQDQERYFFYIWDNVEQIIQDYNLQYTEIMDNKKSYPAFTKKQFVMILKTLYIRVYKPNKELLYNNYYNNKYVYDVHKVELCYTVFNSLCLFYSITPNIELFCFFSGIDKNTLQEWLNSGKSKILMQIYAETDAIDGFSMLNSENSLLRFYYRNNREIDKTEEGSAGILPDLQALPPSAQDEQTKFLENPEQYAN